VKFLIVAVLVLLSACAPQHELATCKGPPFPLNAGAWQPTPADLTPHKVKS
jgi:hypothetical protein